jgi:hypothetical protein
MEQQELKVLLKCLVFRLLAGMAIGVAIFGFWRAVGASMPWPFLRLCSGTLLGVAVFRFFWARSALLGSFLLPLPSDPPPLPAKPRWLYGVAVVAGVAATLLVAF